MAAGTIVVENDYHWHDVGGCGTIRHLVFLVLVVLLLSGCGAAASGEKAEQAGKAVEGSLTTGEAGDPFANIAEADVLDTQAALEEMSSLIKLFKIAVESDDKEGALEQAEHLASHWKAVKSEVETVLSASHDQINSDLGQLLTETAASNWDKTLLIDLDYSLYQGVRDVKQAMQLN